MDNIMHHDRRILRVTLAFWIPWIAIGAIIDVLGGHRDHGILGVPGWWFGLLGAALFAILIIAVTRSSRRSTKK